MTFDLILIHLIPLVFGIFLTLLAVFGDEFV